MSLKSLIATVLFLVLISPPVLVNLCFLAKKNAIRKTIRENLIHNLTDSDLVVLTFTKANAQKELHWEHQDEFEYRGKMYDVVRYKEEGNLIHYWCWPDEPESNLNQKLISVTAKLLNQAPEPKHQGEKLVVFFKALFFEKESQVNLYPPIIISTILLTCGACYHAPALDILETPPRAT